MDIIDYEYEGSAQVCCDECNECYTVEFTGNSSAFIEDTIEEVITSLGWKAGKCPSCIGEEEEKEEDYSEVP